MLLGQRMRRALPAGQALTPADVVLVAAVQRDAPVLLVHDQPGLSLTAQGRALEDGHVGRTVPVLNLVTGSVVLAQVLDGTHARALGPAPAGSVNPATLARATRRTTP